MRTLKLVPVKAIEQTLHVKSNEGKTYKFIAGKNPITRDLGWKPLDIKGFDPVAPVMVVHNIMEHFPDDEGGAHNEYQAQGAAFWLRHEGKYPFLISKDVIAPAFGMLFYHIINSSLKTKKCPLVEQALLPLKNRDTDSLIKETLENAREYISTGDFVYGAGRTLKMPQKGYDILYDSLEQALGWMRIGYLRAAKRYQGLDKRKLVKLFIETQNAVEYYLGQVDYTFSDRDASSDVLSVTMKPSEYAYAVSFVSETSGGIK